MKAQLLINERFELDDMAFADVLLWQVPAPVLGSTHLYKYSLAFVVDGECVLRYDNEAGKGDHKHVGELESVYPFTTPGALLADFWRDVKTWKA